MSLARQGFSLVELVVFTAIIGVLVALLLAASVAVCGWFATRAPGQA